MIACIYCLEDKSGDHYRKSEHVLPKSFGTFAQNFTLRGIVCDDCNQFFGDKLENVLGQDTFEGLSRLEHGVKKPAEFKAPRKSRRIQIKVTEGEFAGSHAYREYDEDTGEVVLRRHPQVGFLLMPANAYEYFLLPDIPAEAELRRRGFDGSQPKSIITLAVDEDTLKVALAEKGISFQRGGDIPSQEPKSILCEVSATMDHIVWRAIAKIAFNYLARWQGADFVRHAAFDPVRKYIRYGEKPDYPLIHVEEAAILEDEPIEGQRRLGHLITTNLAGDGVSIVAQVSLFNWLTYHVSLARDFPGACPDLTRGHMFDIGSRTILELGHRPRQSPQI